MSILYEDSKHYKLSEENAALQKKVEELERLRDFDTTTTPLPKGLMLEHSRLDSMWQELVQDRATLAAKVERLEKALGDIGHGADEGGWSHKQIREAAQAALAEE
jgi:hypothetical protein